MSSSLSHIPSTLKSELGPVRRLIAATLIALQILTPMLVSGHAAAQQINPDRNAPGQRPVVNVGANGVPIVQIAPPSNAGVSRNRFTDYNVSSNGLILNNSGADTQTQLGGWVSGNPMLGNSSARTILNEVTGSTTSRLDGYTEVAGNRANVIVANPNGITCNGCGFVNVGRATLTTGTPQFDANGGVSGFNVQRGQINIEGSGLFARSQDQVDLISCSLRINAEIWANKLEVVTGANQVDYESGHATAQQPTEAAPPVSIDVSQLGGMYANSIRMIGTETGVGVNSAGTISALTGDLEINSAGDVHITGQLQAKANINLQSGQNIGNAGSVYAEGNAIIGAAGQLQNSGLLIAGNVLQAQAASVHNSGAIAAGIDDQGKIVRAGDVVMAAGNDLQNSGQILAGNRVIVSADSATLDQGSINARQVAVTTIGALSNRNAVIAGDDVALTSGGRLDNIGGQIQSQSLTLNALSIDNTGGVLLQSGDGNFNINTQQALINVARPARYQCEKHDAHGQRN